MSKTVPVAQPVADLTGLKPIARRPERARTSDHVFEQLLAAIRDNTLLPGQALSETELAQQLHVSRTPLREAIARLVDAGLVHVIPQVGTRVALISLADVEQARFVRENLEVAAFSELARRPERGVPALRALIRQQQAARRAKDLDGFFDADEAMHRLLFVHSGYPGAWQAVQRMKIHLDRMRRLSLPDPKTLQGLIGEHVAIVDALEAGDVRAGTAVIRVHARRSLEQAPALRRQFPAYFADE